ncbi:MAG: hypothetical protein M3680_01800 [Myxococcota bacterium]|nr:hypothetical protein [Myxococcota bacterium]
MLVFVVATASIPLDITRYGWWPIGFATALHALQAAVLGVWTWRAGKRWSERTCDLAYVFVLAPYLVTIWIPQVHEHQHGMLIEPMIAHHFVLLAIAILPPFNVRWGFSLLALFTAHGLALWGVLEDAATTPALDREPWFTLLFAGISVGLLWSQARRHELALRLARMEIRAEALDGINRVLIALRDRANTPLQTLEVSMACLERRHPGEPSLAAMRRAIGQLTAVQQPVSRAAVVVDDVRVDTDLERELERLGQLPS